MARKDAAGSDTESDTPRVTFHTTLLAAGKTDRHRGPA